MKKYTHVIWDFNGTILADMKAGMDAINQLLAERNLPILRDLNAYRAAFGFPVEDYYRRLGFDFEKEDFKTCLAPLWVKLYEENCKSAPLFPGVEALCRDLRRAGISQSILSASESSMMKGQLQERGALEWFDEIWGTDTILAYGKEGIAHAWRQAHPDAVAVVLGDTVHDFEIANVLRADCILVAAGHHSAERLSGCGVPVVPDLDACRPLLL